MWDPIAITDQLSAGTVLYHTKRLHLLIYLGKCWGWEDPLNWTFAGGRYATFSECTEWISNCEFYLFSHLLFAEYGQLSRKHWLTEDNICIKSWKSTLSFIFYTKLLYDDMDGLVLAVVRAEMHHLIWGATEGKSHRNWSWREKQKHYVEKELKKRRVENSK